MRRREVFYLAGESALLLFVCAAAVGGYEVWREGAERYVDYSVALGIPATASIALILAAVLVPDIVAPGGIRFPLNLTLPIVYFPLTLASYVLWTTNRGSIQAPPDVLRPAEVWTRPQILAYCFLAQVAVLSLVAFARRHEPPIDEP